MIEDLYRDCYGFFLLLLFVLKPDFRQILVKLINLNWNELIWLDRKLSWPPNIIFRLGSKPKSLQTHRNLFGNTQNRLPERSNNVKFSENQFVLENGFFESRPRMAPQADPPRAKCSSIDNISFIFSTKTGLSRSETLLLLGVVDLNPSLSWKDTFSFGAIWDLFLEEYIAFCDGLDIILKYDLKTTF